MSQRSLTPSPSPGGGSRSPTPFHYGKVFRIASDTNVGEFVDGNLWRYRKKGSGSLSPSLFDEFDGVFVKMTDVGVQVELSPVSSRCTSPILAKAIIYELESPRTPDKNNNHDHDAGDNETSKSKSKLNGSAPMAIASSSSSAHNGVNGAAMVQGDMKGSPTYPTASFMKNVHRLHCAVCKTPEKCVKNPTMKLACPIQQCSDPKCKTLFHSCLLEQHQRQNCAATARARAGQTTDQTEDVTAITDTVDSGPPPQKEKEKVQKQKPTSLTLTTLATWKAAHNQAYARKHGSRLPWPVFTVSRDAEPDKEGGQRAYGGAFYSNRFRASHEIYLCEIGFHGPATDTQAKYTVYVDIFEPQAVEPEKAKLRKSKTKSKYRLELPSPSIPLHVYPKGLFKERICTRRWKDVEAMQGEIFYVDLLEDDHVRGMPPVRIQAGIWYLIQFCIEGAGATRNCSRTLEQVKLSLIGTEGRGSSSIESDSSSSSSSNIIQFSFNIGSMQMPELRFVVPNPTTTTTSSNSNSSSDSAANTKAALQPVAGTSSSMFK